MYNAVDILLTEEHQKMIDMISFPHTKKQLQKRILDRYVGYQQAVSDGKTMALRYSSHTKKVGQKWPGKRKDG